MARSLAQRRVAALVGVLALVVGACQSTAPAIDMTDARVTAGAQRSCEELELSAVRCTLVTLRGTKLLDEQRPNHGEIASQALHAAGETASGQSPLPDDTVVPAVVVFTMADGSKIGVPVICPTGADGSDPACDPRTE